MKSAMEAGSSRKTPVEGAGTRKKHECPIFHERGHHWYTCKNGNPEDIAAMEAERGPPKKRLKKTASCATETSIIVAAPASGMVFPHNEVVDKATHKKKGREKHHLLQGSTKGRGQHPLHQQVLQIPDLQLDPMILFLSKWCTQPTIFMKTLDPMKTQHKCRQIKCILCCSSLHQRRKVPSRKS